MSGAQMVSQVTKKEWQPALWISILLALYGLMIAGTGDAYAFSAHGVQIMIFDVFVAVIAISGCHAPEPPIGNRTLWDVAEILSGATAHRCDR